MHYQYDGFCSTAPRTHLNSRLYLSASFTLNSENGFGKKVAHDGWKYCKHSNFVVLLECSHAVLALLYFPVIHYFHFEYKYDVKGCYMMSECCRIMLHYCI